MSVKKDFLYPPNEFTQIPWWFWNDEITEDGIRQQLADFREQEVYGFTVQARMGLSKSIPYLGKRWFELMRFAVEEAARYNMVVHLYDEGMYPSGSAHGQVVEGHPEFLARGLEMRQINPGQELELSFQEKCVAVLPEGESKAVPANHCLDKKPYAAFIATPSNGTIRGVHEGEDDRQADAPKAADLLNPEAIRRFIELTHERYYQELREYFGTTIQAMFTDEPSIMGRCAKSGLKPWTDGLDEDFRRKKGYDLVPLLPALWMDISEQTSAIRRDYEDVVAQRLNESFYQQISDWCMSHSIALTGHPAESDDIGMLRYFQLPGQDMVWRYVEPDKPTALEGKHSTVGKCSSSAARHSGARRNGNEVYGAYGWKLTMDEMKWLADWLMVRGVNLLWQHAFYYSVRDYRVHERPPDLGLHNLWWKHYHIFANYTKRISWLLTDSKQVCNIAIMAHHNHLPWEPAKALFQNQYDFNYIEDELLTDSSVNNGINIGESSYRFVVCMKGQPFSESVERILKSFIHSGGNIITFDPLEDTKFMKQIRKFIPPDIVLEPANPDLRYIHVQKGDYDFYYLTNEGERAIEGEITLQSTGSAEWWDPLSGEFSGATILSSYQDRIKVLLNLERRQGLVLAINPDNPPSVTSDSKPVTVAQKLDISDGWKLYDQETKTVVADTLVDWTGMDGYNSFSGTISYERSVQIPEDGDWILDLGEVHDFAEVFCNDVHYGVRLWGPFRFKIPLKQGHNILRILVTNSMANRIDNASLQSGIMGPVSLELC